MLASIVAWQATGDPPGNAWQCIGGLANAVMSALVHRRPLPENRIQSAVEPAAVEPAAVEPAAVEPAAVEHFKTD